MTKDMTIKTQSTEQTMTTISAKSLQALFILCITVSLLINLNGCSSDNERSAMPKVLKIGILPDESEAILETR